MTFILPPIFVVIAPLVMLLGIYGAFFSHKVGTNRDPHDMAWGIGIFLVASAVWVWAIHKTIVIVGMFVGAYVDSF